jgi:hypothetical protein
MSSSLELQKAIVARLRADITLAGIVGQRVYDNPGPSPTFPYVTVGEDQIIPDRSQGYEGDDVTITLHAWSRHIDFSQAKRIIEAIRASLTDAPLTLTGYRLINLERVDSRTLRDPDGLTSHGVITFLARTEPTDDD